MLREPAPPLDASVVRERLSELPHWTFVEGKLHRDLTFKNFVAAFAFMSACALECERMNHHPEWFNAYRTVRIDLVTHDCGGVTEKDFKLARIFDRWAAQLGAA